jgi:hypothetical protein
MSHSHRFWSRYEAEQREKIALRASLRASGKAMCAHPGCAEPVAPRQMRHQYHRGGQYCVDHTPLGGWERRLRKEGRERENVRRKEWRARVREKRQAVLPRLRSEGL